MRSFAFHPTLVAFSTTRTFLLPGAGHASRLHARRSATRRSTGFRGSAGTLSPFRQRSWDLPFAALILPARLPDVSIFPDPPAVSRALRLDRFHRVSAGVNCHSPATSPGEIPTHLRTRPIAKNPSQLLGPWFSSLEILIGPRANHAGGILGLFGRLPYPSRQSAAPPLCLAATALLPWALPLSGFRTPAGVITFARLWRDASAPGFPLPAPIRSWALSPFQGPLKRTCSSAFS